MAIEVIENFFDWSTTDLSQEGVTQVTCSLTDTTAPRANCSALVLNGSGDYMAWPLSGISTIRFACRVYRMTGINTEVFIFREAGNAHIGIGINGSDYLFAYRYPFTNIGAATTGAIPLNTWTHVEGKIVLHDTAGSVEVRVNGSPSPVLSLSGIDTRNGGAMGHADQAYLAVGAGQIHLTDFVVWNESGESPTGWIGDCRVDTYLPTGAGSSTEFTPSAGTNWSCVDDPDGDTSYVESSTTADLDLYAVGNMTHTPVTIHAVAVTALARKTDAGAGGAKLTMKSGATTAQAAEEGLSDSGYVRKIYARGVDPATSSAWSTSAVNALEAGVESVL